MQNGAGGADGSWRIRAKIERNRMLQEVHAQVSTVLREAPRLDMSKAKLAGEPEALRGLAAVSKNVRGAIRGTEPEAETIGA